MGDGSFERAFPVIRSTLPTVRVFRTNEIRSNDIDHALNESAIRTDESVVDGTSEAHGPRAERRSMDTLNRRSHSTGHFHRSSRLDPARA